MPANKVFELKKDKGGEMNSAKLCTWIGLIVLLSFTASQAAVSDFSGIWRNVDSNTRGITQLNIATAGSKAKLHAWGACHPQDCDWGTVIARYAPADMLKAYYKNSFSERILVLTKRGTAELKVEMRTRYTDNSGRPNSTAVYRFKRIPAFAGRPAGQNAKPDAAHPFRPAQPAAQVGQHQFGATSEPPAGSLKVVYPKGGEELVAGRNVPIQWQSAKVRSTVALMLMVESQLARTMIPTIIAKAAPNTGRYNFRLPVKLNSRYGYRYRIMVQEGDLKTASALFSVYPGVDLTVQNLKVRSKKKGNRWIAWAVAGATGSPAAALIKPKSYIEVEFDLKNMGIDIIKPKFMSKVAVRLDPGNAELNSAGFSHQNIVPGRNYHYKARIDPKDWDMRPGRYRLEIWADPQNNLHEPEPLRDNNQKIIAFQVK